MKRLILVFAALLLSVSVAKAQEATQTSQIQTVEEIIALMATPQEGGIPTSYNSDTRYRLETLTVTAVSIPYLGVNFEVTSEIRAETENWYDQQVRVTGQTGWLPVYIDGDDVWMDVSVISAISRYQTENPEIQSTNIILNTVFKSIPRIGYDRILALEAVVEANEAFTDDILQWTTLLWVQFRDTDDQGELADESTWHGLLLLETPNQDYLLLPTWHMVALEVSCDDTIIGNYEQGVLYCGQDRAEQLFRVRRDQRYGGIYY